MSGDTIKFKIKELDPDMIAPSTGAMNRETQGGTKTVIIGKPGCFIGGTPVLMHNGNIKNVEDVEIGDLVMGDDGTPRKVLELCQNRENMYRIKLKKRDTEYYTVNEGHSLVLKNLYDLQIIEITVKEYLRRGDEWKKEWRIFRNGVDFQPQDTEVDPYFIGLLLTTKGSGDLHENCKKWLSDYASQKKIDGGEIDEFQRPTSLIASEYIINSAPQRLRLLAGIIDSDGWYDRAPHTYHIIKENLNLSKDIVFVARSLGFDSWVDKITQGCWVENTYVENDFYRVTIGGGAIQSIPCMINSKKALQIENDTTYMSTHYDFTVEYVGEDNYYGFVLNGNHRFLLASFDVVRNTGKSTLITSLLYEKSHIFSSGMVCSGTEDSNHHYSQIFPETFIYNKLEKTKIEDFVKRQKIAKRHLPNPWSVLLLDDCTDDPKLFTDPLFHNIFKNGRHYKMWFILSLQYCLDVKPVIRTNIDGTFILRETNLRNRKSLWENYAGVIPDFTMFCEIMDQLTTDYTALYINNATTSNKIEDCVFWYRAKPVPSDFRFGCQDFWEFHSSRFDEAKTIL